jgi:hypothetical protein
MSAESNRCKYCGWRDGEHASDCVRPRSFAAPAGSARSSFERWISEPPYERDIHRWPQDETKHAWPGQYKDIAVQLAWEAWQQAQNSS